MFILDASNIKEARITIFLISVNALLFLFFLLELEEVRILFYLLVQINSKIINNFEIWRLFTSMFLHGNPLHLFSNMVSLLIFGAYVELSFSKYQFSIIYIISGLIGAAFSILILQRDTPLIFLGLIYVFYFIFSSFAPGINYFAHIFGLLGGLLMGYLFKRNKKSDVSSQY